jgi:ssDNA-binding Zn-finger/Zn-ribbon topoisomerase 1
MAYTHSNCSRCQEPLVQAGDAIDFGFVCQNPECPASTANVVDKKCSVCKTRLIIVGWSPRDQYFHGCPNPECGNYSPSGFGEYFDADSDQVLYNMILDTNPNYIANREKRRNRVIAEICNASSNWRMVLDATDDYTIFHIENLFTTDNLAEVAEKYIKSFLTSITAMMDRRGVCIKQPTAYSELLFPSGSPFKVEFYKDAMRKMLRWKYADDPDLDLVDWLDQIGCLFSDWMEEWINELLKIEGPEVEESISVADL